MAKLSYEVIRPWSGVVAGQVVEFEEGTLHPALIANVRLIRAKDADDVDARGIIGEATNVAAELVKAATLQAESIIGAAHVEAEAIKAAAAKK